MGVAIRTVAPTQEPVSLQDLKDHARVTINQEDALLDNYITAAREYAEEYLGQALVSQTWTYDFDRWPRASFSNPLRAIDLPRPPLQSVSGIGYYTAAGTTATLSSTAYQVDAKTRPARIVPAPNDYWPELQTGRINAVTVTYVAGYGGTSSPTVAQSVAAVPQRVKQAILVYAAHLMQERDMNAPPPQVVRSLLDLADFGQYRTHHPDSR